MGRKIANGAGAQDGRRHHRFAADCRHISNDNHAAALHWLDQMEIVFDLLATQPAMGEKVQTQRFGEIRRHVVGNYLIYYWTVAEGVEILRVVHGAREQGQAL